MRSVLRSSPVVLQWLHSDDGMELVLEMGSDPVAASTPRDGASSYRLEILTSDLRHAGTCDTVVLELCGADASSGACRRVGRRWDP